MHFPLSFSFSFTLALLYLLVVANLASTQNIIDCPKAYNVLPAIIPNGIAMIRSPTQNMSSPSLYSNWTLDSTNWQGSEVYPYKGLSFKASVTYFSSSQYVYQLKTIEQETQANKRTFYVKFQNPLLTVKTMKTFYTWTGQQCSSVEGGGPMTQNVLLFEYPQK